jgi:hypothetical protein
VVLSRWVKQSPSANYKVAYVLFTTGGGDPEDLGVYYNWYVSFVKNWYVPLFYNSSAKKFFDRSACDHSITEGGGREVCCFRGYYSYEMAHAAWLGFQQTGILPPSRSHTPYTPQRSSRSTTPHTPQQSSRSTTPYTPQQSSRGTTSQQRSLALSTSPAQVVEQEHDFWVVLSGYEPGVYQTK